MEVMLEKFFERLNELASNQDKRFDEVGKHFNEQGRRLENIEKQGERFENIDKRLKKVENLVNRSLILNGYIFEAHQREHIARKFGEKFAEPFISHGLFGIVRLIIAKKDNYHEQQHNLSNFDADSDIQSSYVNALIDYMAENWIEGQIQQILLEGLEMYSKNVKSSYETKLSTIGLERSGWTITGPPQDDNEKNWIELVKAGFTDILSSTITRKASASGNTSSSADPWASDEEGEDEDEDEDGQSDQNEEESDKKEKRKWAHLAKLFLIWIESSAEGRRKLLRDDSGIGMALFARLAGVKRLLLQLDFDCRGDISTSFLMRLVEVKATLYRSSDKKAKKQLREKMQIFQLASTVIHDPKKVNITFQCIIIYNRTNGKQAPKNVHGLVYTDGKQVPKTVPELIYLRFGI
jgi:hypothetical protein